MNWWTYVVRTSGTDSPKAMEAKTQIDAPNFSKWKGGQIPGPHIVAAFARAYRVPVLEAFIAAGFLTAQEAKERPTAAPAISSLSDDELVDEIRRRMRAGDGDAGRDSAPMKVAARRVGRAPSGQEQTEEEQAAELGLNVVRPAVERAAGLELGEIPGEDVTGADDAG